MREVVVLWTGTGRCPIKHHRYDAGWDLFVSRPETVPPGETREVHTDISVAIGAGYYGHIIARSSTIYRYGLKVAEAVIDSGYRGELFFTVTNTSDKTVIVDEGSRLAQLLIIPVPRVEWVRAEEVMRDDGLPNSDRGPNGFGSTGQ